MRTRGDDQQGPRSFRWTPALVLATICAVLLGTAAVLFVVNTGKHREKPAVGSQPSANRNVNSTVGWIVPKAESLTNIRITEKGMELGPETSRPTTMWAAGFTRIGLILSETVDPGSPVEQVLVRYTLDRPDNTLFMLQIRGSQDGQTWTEWSEVTSSGAAVRLRAPSRYLQYWVHLAANDVSPVIREIALMPLPSEGGISGAPGGPVKSAAAGTIDLAPGIHATYRLSEQMYFSSGGALVVKDDAGTMLLEKESVQEVTGLRDVGAPSPVLIIMIPGGGSMGMYYY